ncbi:hypothetical protein BDK51DRAFT_33227, partial [Blyttiomyces helicus]
MERGWRYVVFGGAADRGVRFEQQQTRRRSLWADLTNSIALKALIDSVLADWPEDIAHLTLPITGDGDAELWAIYRNFITPANTTCEHHRTFCLQYTVNNIILRVEKIERETRMDWHLRELMPDYEGPDCLSSEQAREAWEVMTDAVVTPDGAEHIYRIEILHLALSAAAPTFSHDLALPDAVRAFSFFSQSRTPLAPMLPAAGPSSPSSAVPLNHANPSSVILPTNPDLERAVASIVQSEAMRLHRIAAVSSAVTRSGASDRWTAKRVVRPDRVESFSSVLLGAVDAITELDIRDAEPDLLQRLTALWIYDESLPSLEDLDLAIDLAFLYKTIAYRISDIELSIMHKSDVLQTIAHRTVAFTVWNINLCECALFEIITKPQALNEYLLDDEDIEFLSAWTTRLPFDQEDRDAPFFNTFYLRAQCAELGKKKWGADTLLQLQIQARTVEENRAARFAEAARVAAERRSAWINDKLRSLGCRITLEDLQEDQAFPSELTEELEKLQMVSTEDIAVPSFDASLDTEMADVDALEVRDPLRIVAAFGRRSARRAALFAEAHKIATIDDSRIERTRACATFLRNDAFDDRENDFPIGKSSDFDAPAAGAAAQAVNEVAEIDRLRAAFAASLDRAWAIYTNWTKDADADTRPQFFAKGWEWAENGGLLEPGTGSGDDASYTYLAFFKN